MDKVQRVNRELKRARRELEFAKKTRNVESIIAAAIRVGRLEVRLETAFD